MEKSCTWWLREIPAISPKTSFTNHDMKETSIMKDLNIGPLVFTHALYVSISNNNNQPFLDIEVI